MAASQKKADQKNGPMKDARAEGTADSADAAQANEQERLSEKKRRELWLYLAVSIVAVELLLVVGAVFYSFISAARSGGGAVPAFPWLMWGSLAVLFPAVILLAVHHADVGLFRSSKNGDGDAEWQAHLPDRMRRLYRVVKGAPAVVVLLGVVLLGGALLTMEGALSALGSLAAARPWSPPSNWLPSSPRSLTTASV